MNAKNLEIKMKSSRSKKAPKKSQKKQRQTVKTITVVKSQLQHWLDIHEQIWHDDDYDAGKDW